MTSRERIVAAINHRQPDKLAVDFGGGFQTGIAVSIVYKLRQEWQLDPPGTPVKVTEPYQMLGEVKADLAEALCSDTVSLAGTGTMFGFPAKEFKEWNWKGTPVLVPVDFNTEYEPNGDLLQYPGGDRTVPASGHMPATGYFFDATIRNQPADENALDPADNCEEFKPIAAAEVDHYRRRADELHTQTDRALFCSFGGLAFGDIALVPATFLKHPKGIRGIEDWYMATVEQPEYIKNVFDFQSEVAIENLKRLKQAVGDKPTVIQTSGTDFGTQNGPFCSAEAYRSLYLPFQKRVNGWIHENTNWKTLMHCCGGVAPLLDAIIEAGFDILNPVQCSATGMDARWLKRNYGKQLVFWGGGVDTQHTLPFGTPDDVRKQVRERIEIFSPGGGYVFNTIHNIVANTPIPNLLAMFDVVREYR